MLPDWLRALLALAEHVAAESRIYVWRDSEFVEFQSIPTSFASGLEHFTIDNETYLAVANHRNLSVPYGASSSYVAESRIYVWNGSAFEEFQSFATDGAESLKFFEVGGAKYLAVAANSNSLSGVVAYRWTGAKGAALGLWQHLAGERTISVEFFSFNGESYLAAAMDSINKIYKWESSHSMFQDLQTIVADRAHGCMAFEVSNVQYLVLANLNEQPPHLYAWNGSSFEHILDVGTTSAYSSQFFGISGTAYLAVAAAGGYQVFEFRLPTSSSSSTTATRTTTKAALGALGASGVKTWPIISRTRTQCGRAATLPASACVVILGVKRTLNLGSYLMLLSFLLQVARIWTTRKFMFDLPARLPPQRPERRGLCPH